MTPTARLVEALMRLSPPTRCVVSNPPRAQTAIPRRPDSIKSPTRMIGSPAMSDILRAPAPDRNGDTPR